MVGHPLCNLATVPAISSHDPATFVAPLLSQFESFLDDHRDALYHCLDDLTEEEARQQLVASKTTLLGLVKHAIFVELVWFNEAITCHSRAEIGCPDGPDESFKLEPRDTIQSVRNAYKDVCEASRTAAATVGLDDLVHGNRRGPLPLPWVYLHMLRELSQHCGHADILREQILAGRRIAQVPSGPAAIRARR
jgi:hypothetical protein